MELTDLRKTVATVAILNIFYFFIEFTFAQILGSLSLLSDSLDFLEDASINLLIFIAFAWSIMARKILSYFLALLLLIPGALFVLSAIARVNDPVVPNGRGMSIIGIGALIINLYCAYILVKHKKAAGGLAKAAYLSARNDALANVLIICAGVFTLFWRSHVPDLLIGLAIFIMNFDAAIQVINTQRHR
jgi:Co/Zn/Cd efflux system component